MKGSASGVMGDFIGYAYKSAVQNASKRTRELNSAS